jgi:hypothetical protein
MAHLRLDSRPISPLLSANTYSGTNIRTALCRAMQWIEALINMSAFAGFIGVATHWPTNHQTD